MRYTKAKIKYKNALSEQFVFNKEVKQGDGLQATLFVIALHYTVKDTEQRGTTLNTTSQIYAYSTDVATLARSRPVSYTHLDVYKRQHYAVLQSSS